MPELPEVESLSRELHRELRTGPVVRWIHCLRPDLRFPLPLARLQFLCGQSVKAVSRRAKFLLFHMGEESLVGHLGMTGSWRFGEVAAEGPHDHLALEFGDGRFLIYNDPRRFGFIDVVKTAELETCRWFRRLGPEPLDKNLQPQTLKDMGQNSTSPIKIWIMNQSHIVGVGNIYASEALFRAGIHPLKKTHRLSVKEWALLLQSVQKVLGDAISSGGTTLRDYRRLKGDKGAFQNHLLVYGRAGQACPMCKSLIQSSFLQGRNTYWCPRCQRKGK